ncbi:MAG: hypothetical protein H8E97_07800, partial [Bacteroidetes bacterium]|nr:hypothetical protein [Bacteroidota bacterium]
WAAGERGRRKGGGSGPDSPAPNPPDQRAYDGMTGEGGYSAGYPIA